MLYTESFDTNKKKKQVWSLSVWIKKISSTRFTISQKLTKTSFIGYLHEELQLENIGNYFDSVQCTLKIMNMKKA